MPVNQRVQVQGSVTLGPVLPTSAPFPSMDTGFSISVDQTRGVSRPVSRSISVVDPAWLNLLTDGGFTSVRFVVLRVNGGTATIRFTTPQGADQVMTVSDLFVWSSPQVGGEMTALAIRGSCNIEGIIAGD